MAFQQVLHRLAEEIAKRGLIPACRYLGESEIIDHAARVYDLKFSISKRGGGRDCNCSGRAGPQEIAHGESHFVGAFPVWRQRWSRRICSREGSRTSCGGKG